MRDAVDVNSRNSSGEGLATDNILGGFVSSV